MLAPPGQRGLPVSPASVSKVYGLTGGIASGKSTVAQLLRERGAVVVDADELARDVVAPGTDGHAAIVKRFGTQVLLDDGALDRKSLGDIVFADPGARHDLEAILHPRIADASAVAIARALAAGDEPVFYDAALLVERGAHRGFAGLVVVACARETQIARLRRRDGLGREAAVARLDAQMPLAEKVSVADWVIDNEGPVDALPAQLDRLLATLRSAH